MGLTSADHVISAEKAKGFADPESMYDAWVHLSRLAVQEILPRKSDNVF